MESLYRKYRPQTFADVVGQTHVVGTLERAVIEGRTSHAYLFCGPRGTGKTTMARLLAKALMCEQGQGHLPDGSCEQCRLIAAGEHPDVYELDAASRTGVDNVREEIINSVGYAPVMARCKLYIIDEVHMLTTAAFNALLKTLEEPPEHVIFVLCTTDPQKIPQTILSRVQRFDFRPISNDDIERRLVHVCDREGFTYEDEALKLVVTNARGGMRDALSTLEQLSVFGGGKISADAARDLLGALPGQELDQVVAALAERDVATLFQLVETLANEGRDLLQFVRELAARVRDVYVVQVVGNKAERVLGPAVGVDRLARDATSFGSADRLARILSLLGDVSREMAVAPNQRLVLEICFTRIARPETDLTIESLAERVAELETRLASYEAGAPQQRYAQTSRVAESTLQAERDAISSSAQSANDQHEVASAASVPDALLTGDGGYAGSQGAREPREVPTQPQATSEERFQQASQRQAVSRTSQPNQDVRDAAVPSATPHPSSQASEGLSRVNQKPDLVASAPAVRPEPQRQSSSAAIKDAGSLQRMWKQVIAAMVERNPARGSLLSSSHVVGDDGQRLEVALPPGSTFSLKMLERKDVRKILDGCVSQVFGTREVHFSEGGAQQPAPVAQSSEAVSPRPRQSEGQRRPDTGQRPQQSRQTAPAYRASAPAPARMVEPAQMANGRVEGAYPMPWDAPTDEAPATIATVQPTVESALDEPYYEQVPYEEIGGFEYDEFATSPFPPDVNGDSQDAYANVTPAASAKPPAPAAIEHERQSAVSTAANRAPAALEVAQTPTPADTRRSEPPAQAPKERTATMSKNGVESGHTAGTFADELSPELIAILENAFEVFGNDVKVKRER